MGRDAAGLEHVMPLPAVVGHEPVKLALLLLAVNPRLGGLLIRGEKGTGKSTLARGLARLLPAVEVNEGCRFGCLVYSPASWCDACRELDAPPGAQRRRAAFETLPLGITEDQLLGSLDLERALRGGERRFEAGLLARVNHGVLYVDEVNLLDDHIVDLLLDVAVSKVNVVAREGVSVSHPAEFLLVGTMNPEEGEIRPQLLDRFGLCAQIRRLEDPELRAEIVARCLEFEKEPVAFRSRWAQQEQELTGRIEQARTLLGRVEVSREWHLAAARLSLALDVDGHRADLLLVKAALTLCALEGRTTVEPMDLERVAPLVFAHRIKRHPFEEHQLSDDELQRTTRRILEQPTVAPEKKSPAPD